METCSGVVHTGMCVYVLVPSTQFYLIERKKKNSKQKRNFLTQRTIYEQRMKKSSGKRSQGK